MNFVLDIGNTKIKFAVFDGNELIHCLDYIDKNIDKFHNQLKKYQQYDNRCIISAVRDIPVEIKKILEANCIKSILLDHHTPLPFKNLYQTPETLGKDRLAAIAGAYNMYPHEPILVIDAGTAITYDFINKKGEYVGGNISPGMHMRFEALHNYTHQLPLVKQFKDFIETGTDTESAINSGIQVGIIHEIDGYIAHYKLNYKNIKILFTGGDANFFVNKLKNTIFVDLNLVLKGLNYILNYNTSVPND